MSETTSTRMRGFATLGTAVLLLSMMVMATLYRAQFARFEQRILTLDIRQQALLLAADAVLERGLAQIIAEPSLHIPFLQRGQFNDIDYVLEVQRHEPQGEFDDEELFLIRVVVQHPQDGGELRQEQQVRFSPMGIERVRGSWRDF